MIPALLRRLWPTRPDAPAPTGGTLRTRRWEGASSAPRTTGFGSFGPINDENAGSLPTLRARSLYQARNNPWVANGVAALVAALAGNGIVPASGHPDRSVRQDLDRLWRQWVRVADADGLTDFYGCQVLAVRCLVEQGEAFVQLLTDQTGRLRVRLIDPGLVDATLNRELGGGARIVSGIEFDAAGRRVAYHVAQQSGSGLGFAYAPALRLPAGDVTHLFVPVAPGQVRGVPWTALIIAKANDLDATEDALLVQQKVAALFGAFVTDPSGDPASDPFAAAADPMPPLEPGITQVLPQGWDVKFSTPGQASEGVAFIRSQLRAMAAGLGVPVHLMTGDLSEANYSSLRAAMVAFRRQTEMVQFSFIIPQLCRPIWERFVSLAVLNGDLVASNFDSASADYLDAEFYPPKQEWVDPLKDGQAEALAVASGFKSRRQVLAELGYDIEVVDAEIAADRDRAAGLGLAFPIPAAPVPPGAAP